MDNVEIVRNIDKERSGEVFEREILGLNILDEEPFELELSENPQLEFLRQIVRRNRVAANVGSLSDYADSPQELFGNINFVPVRIGCMGGDFYDNRKWEWFPAILIEDVPGEFVDLMDGDESLMMKILLLDAIALFVSPRTDDACERLREVLNDSFVSSADVITRATELFDLLILSQADRDYFSVFSRNRDKFAILDAPIKAAVEMIGSSPWFRRYQSELIWDDENSCCLRRPETMRKKRELN